VDNSIKQASVLNLRSSLKRRHERIRTSRKYLMPTTVAKGGERAIKLNLPPGSGSKSVMTFKRSGRTLEVNPREAGTLNLPPHVTCTPWSLD
jgi:hypothetical protein